MALREERERCLSRQQVSCWANKRKSLGESECEERQKVNLLLYWSSEIRRLFLELHWRGTGGRTCGQERWRERERRREGEKEREEAKGGGVMIACLLSPIPF